MKIYKHNGRFVVASYDERNCQYTGWSPRAAKTMGPGYRYTFARKLADLVDLGVPSYATLASARRALARYEEE